MIGSMPHSSAGAALAALGRNPLSLPAWPQLPKRDFREWMIPQCSEGFPGVVMDLTEKTIKVDRGGAFIEELTAFYENAVAENFGAMAISADFAQGLHAFLGEKSKNGRKPKAAKGQITGPLTFGLGLSDSEGRAVWFDDEYRDVVLKGLAMKALWQAGELKKIAEKVFLFLDEPIFSALGTAAYAGIRDEDVVTGLNEVAAPLNAAGVSTGVHCCGNMDWGLLARTDIGVIAFDALCAGEKLALYPAEINAFLEKGGALAFGLVPTDSSEKLRSENAASLRRLLEGLLELYEKKGLRLDLVRERSYLTPSCGMGSLPEEDAELVLKLLKELSS